MNIKTNTLKFTIPQGSYNLNEICEIITDECINVNNNGSSNNSEYPINNIFLTTDRQLRADQNIPTTEKQYYIREDGQQFFFLRCDRDRYSK